MTFVALKRPSKDQGSGSGGSEAQKIRNQGFAGQAAYTQGQKAKAVADLDPGRRPQM